MISKTYSCDSCGERCGQELRGWRTKLFKKEAKLVALSDGSASETVLCEKCIPAIGRSFEQIKLKDAEKPPQLPFPEEEEAA